MAPATLAPTVVSSAPTEPLRSASPPEHLRRGRDEPLTIFGVQLALIQNNGTVDLAGGAMNFPLGVDLNGGQLIGEGTFTGPIRNNAGIVGPVMLPVGDVAAYTPPIRSRVASFETSVAR